MVLLGMALLLQRKPEVIKKKIVEIPAKEAEIKEIIIWQCDCCDHESSDRNKFTQCILCKRIICRGWINSCKKHDPHELGDYPDHYCPICYKLKFEKYEKQFSDLESQYDSDIEDLLQWIKKESLETK